MPKQAMGSWKMNALPFDSTVIRFHLEHHPLDINLFMGAQWLSCIVLDSRPRGRGFEPQRRHCVVVREQDTFILA